MSDLTSTFSHRLNGEKSSGIRVRKPQLETIFNSFQVSKLRQVAYCLRVLVSSWVKCEYNFNSTYYAGLP